MTISDSTTCPGLADVVPAEMRQEAAELVAKISAATAELRPSLERAMALHIEGEHLAYDASEAAQAAGLPRNAVDAALEVVSALAGSAELHGALTALCELCDPDTDAVIAQLHRRTEAAG